jgi:hypothetical protein
MKRRYTTRAFLLLTISVVMFIMRADAQKQVAPKAPAGSEANVRQIQEVRGKLAASTVPQECLTLVRQLVAYLSQAGNDLTKDQKAQQRWLTENLSERLSISVEVCQKMKELHPDEHISCPDNTFFIGTGYYPATYSIVGSRRYDDRVLVDLEFEWRKDKDYPDDKMLLSYVLSREEDGWKLCDIYAFGGEVRGDIITGNSLSEELDKLANYLMLSSRIPSPFIDYQLSGAVVLGQRWLELTPKEPLKVERDTQEVALFPDPPIKMVNDPTGKRTLIPSDNRDATIEVELVDNKGATYRSSPGYSQSMTGDLYITSHSLRFKDLPKDATFKTVRIRSSVPYPVKKILWRCYNWSEAYQ